MFQKVVRKLQADGFQNTSIHAYKRLFRPPCVSFTKNADLLSGMRGIEIGGPSRIFSPGGTFPAYRVAASVDNCNFNHETRWEGNIHEGNTFHFNNRRAPGRQYIGEAWNLDQVGDCSFDFVLSSHMIEHTANPIRAMREWLRVLKRGGLLVVVFPLKTGAFDHRRPTTLIDHLVADYEEQTEEDDLTHLPEILELHDLQLDPEAGTLEQFAERSRKNVQNRCLHHHVFDAASTSEIFAYLDLRQLAIEVIEPIDIVTVCRKR